MVNPKTLKTLEIMLFDGSAEEKEKALKELLKINTIESHSIIKKALREGNEELQYFIKKKFSSALHKDNFKEKIKKTVREKNKSLNLKNLKKYLTNSDSRKRLRAVEVAAGSGDVKSLPLLLDLAENEKDDFVKATIAKNLGLFKDKSLIPVISKYLNDPDARVRANAIEGLEIIDDEDVIEYITPMLRDSNNRVQANAAKVLAKFDIAEVMDVFEKMLNSYAVWQRESALYGLKSIKSVETIPLITNVIKNDSNEAIRIEALKVLDSFSESVKKEKLKELRENQKVSNNIVLMEMINKKLNIHSKIEEEQNVKQTPMPVGIKIAILAFFCIFTLVTVAGGYHFYSVKKNIENEKKSNNNQLISQNSLKKENKLSKNINNENKSKEISNKNSNNVNNNENKLNDRENNVKSIKAIKSNEKNDVKAILDLDYDNKKQEEENNLDLIDLTDKDVNLSEKISDEKESDKNVLSLNETTDVEMNIENESIKNNIVETENKEIVSDTKENKVETNEEQINNENSDEPENKDEMSIAKLNNMLSKIENLKEDINKEDEELSSLKQVKENIEQKNQNIPVESFKNDKMKRVILLPADISSVNQVFNIFSNGYMFSGEHILEPIGKEINFVDYFTIANFLKRYSLKPEDIKTSTRQRDRLINELNGDYIIFTSIKESGSYFQEYWDNYINSNQLSNIEKELTDNSYLMAKVDPLLDIEDMDFFEENDIDEREEIAYPFYQKGVELYNKKQYKESYQEFKIAKAIAPDSKRFNIDNQIDKAKNSFILSLNRREDDLLNRIRISITSNMIDKEGNEVWNFKSNKNAEDYTDIFMSMFGSIKNYFGSDGVLYSNFDSINGHSKDFKAIVYFYRGLEYLLKEKNDIDERANTTRNITLRHKKAMSEFDVAQELSEDFSLVYIVKSYINFLENKQIEGLNNLKKAIENEPQRLSLQYRVAMYQEQLGNKDEAYKIFDKISSYQNSTVYDNVKILSLVKIIKKDIANKEFSKVLNRVEYGMKIKSSDDLMFLKVFALYNLNLYNKANDNAKILKRLYPKDVVISYIYGNILFELNSKQLAIEEYKSVLENFQNVTSSKFYNSDIMEITKSDVFLKIGMLYQSINNKNLAESYFKQVIAVAPYSEHARKARNLLANL